MAGCLLAACLVGLADRPRSPFGVTVSRRTNAQESSARISFVVPPECVLYADKIHIEMEDGGPLELLKMPPPELKADPVTGKEKAVYEHSFLAEVKCPETLTNLLVVRFQGCSNSACFFPDKRLFALGTNGNFRDVTPAPRQEAEATEAPKEGWAALAGQFKVVARGTGYLTAREFVAFLESSSGKAKPQAEGEPKQKMGLLATLFFILLGGVGLNLTPCVLPLIPINLAIIGAGTRARSRAEGFRQGAFYGAGMALAYGILGLAVVLTGAKFGTLNSSVWFNVCIALVFVVMAAAMFGWLNVDFSNFGSAQGWRPATAGTGGIGRAIGVFFLGAVAALLAGACVAPVVISVLLLSTDLYSRGVVLGLGLPFLLGLGMALPWPFAGAGLAFLPKPGKWMAKVKQVFGVLILIFAAYYAHTAYDLMRTAPTPLAGGPRDGALAPADVNEDLARQLQQAQAQKRPVFIDFQAGWCKDCVAMDQTVFNRTNVQQRLQDFVVVKYPADRPNERPARDVLDRFNVLGLPTYLVLIPNP